MDNFHSSVNKGGDGDISRSMDNQPACTNNKIDTLEFEESLGPSLVEVRFVEQDEPGKEGTMPTARAKEKIGHRRVDELGEVSYKRVPTNALMGAIQLGIADSIETHEQKARDILVQDFPCVDIVAFPPEGSQKPHTPPHDFGDFRFKSYAPNAFRYFRRLFKIKPADFLTSLCSQPMQELSNPGASGSIFYVSADNKFIVKTIQHKEAEFLRALLPYYYLHLDKNPRTLLPKFFGLFCYQTSRKNIRLLVMNNLLPQAITLQGKFDLKGSTYKRVASQSERAKDSPTLKDLDFNEMHKTGLQLEPSTFDTLMDTIKRDCLVLESFEIMDYSILIGIHNIDMEATNSPQLNEKPSKAAADDEHSESTSSLRTEAWKSLQLDFRGSHESGGLPAKNEKGEKLLLFLGIIDILQSYRLFKKLEHAWKSVFYDGETISVCNPNFYASRFQTYLRTRVFAKAMVDPPYRHRNPNRFRSLARSFLAIKQAPTRQLFRRNQGGSTHEQHQKLEMEPTTSRNGTLVRRSYTTPLGKTTDGHVAQKAATEKRIKQKERLFANTNPGE